MMHPSRDWPSAPAEIAPIPGSGGGLQDSAEVARLREQFLHWAHCSLECVLSTLKHFRRFDDDDITALYLCLWIQALESQDRIPPSVEYSVSNFMSVLSNPVSAGASLAQLSEATGIPRETVRRKLEEAVKFRIVERCTRSGFRLSFLSADILPLFADCLALANQLLHALGRPPSDREATLSLASWVTLMRSYLSVILGAWAERRSMTRGAAAVSVQISVELMTALKIYRRLAATGRLSRVDLAVVLGLVPECWATPYFLVQIAAIARLDIGHVRRMCRNLARQKKVRFSGTGAIHPIAPVGGAAGQMPMLSSTLRDAGFRFIAVAKDVLGTPPASPREGMAHG